MPLESYFSDFQFRSYFLNVAGNVHYSLPGVFTTNPAGSVVNGQLWTIPYELKCYLVLAALAALGIFRRREFLLLALVGLYVFQIRHMILKPDIGAHSPMSGNSLVMTFIAGVTAYKFREKIPCNWYLFVICLALTMGSSLVTGGDRVAALPATYTTVFLGLLTLWWWLPKWQVNLLRLEIPDAKARADVEDNFRKTIGQLLGADQRRICLLPDATDLAGIP